VLEVRGLTKHYSVGRVGQRKVIHALNDVDLSIARGEVLSLVGESGSGKTTFARTISFLERPTAGTILVDGAVLAHHPKARQLREHRRKVQIIFQDPYSSLDPLHTVRHSVAQPLRAFSIVERREESDEIEDLLTQVGLVPAGDFLRRYPHELSGGQRQRVGIARALAARPSLILADEPTSMLDVSIRLTIMNLLLDLQKSRGLSLVFITHDLGAAYYMSDRIAIMYAGRVVELGGAASVMGEPRHPYTQLLRSAAPDPEYVAAERVPGGEEGDPPDLTALGPGCPFAPRCPHVRPECLTELPDFREADTGSYVRCVLVERKSP
jgi:peptide/nickel transport system ATP-binding protein